MGRLFGTDGIRGVANRELTAELALDLSVAAAHILTEAEASRPRRTDRPRPRAVVGRDPRASSEFLEAAVVAGLASAGVDVLRLGVVPTPGVAFLTAELDADLGVMLSASHNPMPDNGIKFFARGGYKLDDAEEDAIERRMGEVWRRPIGSSVGRVRDLEDAVPRYVEHLVGTVPARLAGLTLVVDTANGAAYSVLPTVLRTLGAEMVAIHSEPDGLNINDGCGSTHMEDLRRAVVEQGADAGIAVDGDADRCLAVDAEGDVVDGDQILAILALALRDRGRLHEDTVVATVMSNLGFMRAMEGAGVRVLQTKVGDRYVLGEMRAYGCTLGGEQSGHIIMSEHSSTGDGLLTAVQLLARMVERGETLRDLAAVMTRLPQVLVNVPSVDRSRVGTDPAVLRAVEKAEAELGGTGRVLLRPSGTEPIVRVMVEAESAGQAERVASDLAQVVRAALGSPG
ncbi:MAG: phosphoglucosamine mutase [Propionibacteriales bacterium]|nr:phosphoglucosamine mutase [Propionibacteriales bacterium]